MITAIFGLPAVGVCLIACAKQWLHFMEYLLVKSMNEVKVAFHHFDTDESGVLDLDEYRNGALQCNTGSLRVRIMIAYLLACRFLAVAGIWVFVPAALTELGIEMTDSMFKAHVEEV